MSVCEATSRVSHVTAKKAHLSAYALPVLAEATSRLFWKLSDSVALTRVGPIRRAFNTNIGKASWNQCLGC